MQKNLDHAFDEYLKENSEEAAKNISQFYKRLKNVPFKYGRHVIPTFYKSHFLKTDQERVVKRASKALAQVINTGIRLFFEERHLFRYFQLESTANHLIQIDPGYSEGVVFMRLNALLEGTSYKVVDFNCDSPVGAVYADSVEKAFFDDGFLKSFEEENHLIQSSRAEKVLEVLLEIYEEFGGFETPNIVICDWRGTRTMDECEGLREHFESKGYKTVIADPRELRYKNGKLYHKQTPVRLMLRRFFFHEIVERADEVEDLIKAYKDKAFCMVNPLRSELANSKAMLSFLTNSDYDHYFTDAENEAKREFLVWTRRMCDAQNFYGNQPMYLIDFLKDEKETLVLKPASSSGGRDILIGCETPDKEWNEAIDRAIKEEWIVQEFVNVPIMTVPEVINKKLDFSYKKFNFNPLVFGGKYAGGFVRLSDDSVVSVARKGGLIPSSVSDSIPDRFGG